MEHDELLAGAGGEWSGSGDGDLDCAREAVMKAQVQAFVQDLCEGGCGRIVDVPPGRCGECRGEAIEKPQHRHIGVASHLSAGLSLNAPFLKFSLRERMWLAGLGGVVLVLGSFVAAAMWLGMRDVVALLLRGKF